jgi:hemoglobin
LPQLGGMRSGGHPDGLTPHVHTDRAGALTLALPSLGIGRRIVARNTIWNTARRGSGIPAPTVGAMCEPFAPGSAATGRRRYRGCAWIHRAIASPTAGIGCTRSRLRGVGEAATLYEAVGGMTFFEELVSRFYDGVEGDPQLLDVYPRPDDLSSARRHLTLFLAQYWGGPQTYDQERGHPALRKRHARFAIGPDAKDRWLMHMRSAVRSLDPEPDVSAALLEYFEMAAASLQNKDRD